MEPGSIMVVMSCSNCGGGERGFHSLKLVPNKQKSNYLVKQFGVIIIRGCNYF